MYYVTDAICGEVEHKELLRVNYLTNGGVGYPTPPHHGGGVGYPTPPPSWGWGLRTVLQDTYEHNTKVEFIPY